MGGARRRRRIHANAPQGKSDLPPAGVGVVCGGWGDGGVTHFRDTQGLRIPWACARKTLRTGTPGVRLARGRHFWRGLRLCELTQVVGSICTGAGPLVVSISDTQTVPWRHPCAPCPHGVAPVSVHPRG